MADESSDQATDALPPPHPELQRLEPLLGTWNAEDHTHDSMLGAGVPVTSTETFSWFDGGYFLVSTYETVFGDEPPQRGVNYWGYDADAQRFRIMFFSNNGPFTEQGNRYEGKVANGTLTFEGPARFQHELDDQGKIKTNAAGTIAVAWWLRDANGEWEPWMNNTFTKVRAQPVRVPGSRTYDSQRTHLIGTEPALCTLHRPSRPTHRISVRTLIVATGDGTCGPVVKAVSLGQDPGGLWIAAAVFRRYIGADRRFEGNRGRWPPSGCDSLVGFTA